MKYPERNRHCPARGNCFDYFDRACDTCDFGKAFHKLHGRIATMKRRIAKMQENKWIDAACPPAVSDEYIVQIAGAQKATCLYYDADEGVWFDDREGEIVYRVTKWMALPLTGEEENESA